LTPQTNADDRPFPIARVDGDPTGRTLSAMNTTIARDYLKCAAPECSSEARDGHVCGYHRGTLYADRTFGASTFFVMATDPDAEWRRMQFRVRAMSELQAKAAARGELAKEKRDHWSLTIARIT
jgi:hypothetical protein